MIDVSKILANLFVGSYPPLRLPKAASFALGFNT